MFNSQKKNIQYKGSNFFFILKYLKDQDLNFQEIAPRQGHQKNAVMKNLHQKLKVVLQVRENTCCNCMPESPISSDRNGLLNKI